MKKVVIIGGVTGGAGAAARLSRLANDIEIIMFEKGKSISYAHCGLPYYASDVIQVEDTLLHEHPESMKAKFNIDVRLESEVTKINRAEKTITVKNLSTGEDYQQGYDTLLISTGSTNLIPNVEGVNNDRVIPFWTLDDANKVKKFVKEHSVKDMAIVGGGYIGLELAENFKEAGINIHLVESTKQVLNELDFEMAQLLHEELINKDVDLHLEESVSSFMENGSKLQVILNSGKTINTDLVVLAMGAKPNSQLAKDAGLDIGSNGGILVDKHLLTSDPNIYAVGDVIEVKNMVTGEKTLAGLAGPTNRQARIVANNILGEKLKYKGTMNTSVVKVFEQTAAFTGVNEEKLLQMGMLEERDFYKAYITQNDLADYFPGALPMVVKLLFSTDGKKIFGAQIVGMNGVDKRIDVIATAMSFGASVSDLANLELAYTAPFSSGKDPVNMIGFIAENRVKGIIGVSNWDLNKHPEAVLLDIRETPELFAFEVPNAINVPLSELRNRLDELDKEKEIILFCRMGLRAYNAARILVHNGFKNVKIYPAGIKFYQATHYKELSMEDKMQVSSEENKVETATEVTPVAKQVEGKIIPLNCMGLQCPGPLMQVAEAIKEIDDGDILDIKASDPGFIRDITAWSKKTGNSVIDSGKDGNKYLAKVQKGGAAQVAGQGQGLTVQNTLNGQTMVVFSGDFDKVFAAFIIANGAAVMGKEVTMFFTFWGLTALRKSNPPKVKKGFMEKMFGIMLPKGTSKLGLSRMNMGGMGTKMMKKIMKDKNVNSLEDLVKSALDSGVKIMACTMSMDVMGITKEELIDGIEYVGVGTYLGDAEESNVNLFI